MPFVPDSMLVHQVLESPNRGERADHRAPDMLILHYTGMPTLQGALDRLASPLHEVSCHYVVTEDGRIIQMVPESLRAWHAGEANWDGESDINSRSIGIEIVNPGHDHGYPDFPTRQIGAVCALCRSILRRHVIRADRILAHSDVAPSRKNDPGEKFPWAILHRSGIGHWVGPSPIQPGPALGQGDSGEAIQNFQTALREYGYGVPTDGVFDPVTRDVVIAFQRHFRPALCDGRVDISTLATLRRLIEARGLRGHTSSAA